MVQCEIISEESMKDGLVEMVVKHMPKPALRTYLNLEAQPRSLFGADYHKEPVPRRKAPWKYWEANNFYQQCEYEPSGELDGRCIIVYPHKAV